MNSSRKPKGWCNYEYNSIKYLILKIFFEWKSWFYLFFGLAFIVFDKLIFMKSLFLMGCWFFILIGIFLLLAFFWWLRLDRTILNLLQQYPIFFVHLLKYTFITTFIWVIYLSKVSIFLFKGILCIWCIFEVFRHFIWFQWYQ